MKVIRTYSNSDLQRIIGVNSWLYSLSACLRTDVPRVEVLQRGCDLENSTTSECLATDRGDDIRDSVCNDIGLDGKRKHLRLREGTPRCEPIGTGRLFAQSRHLRFKWVDDRWLIQLGGVARGLIYIHSQGMIHGDLKGVCSRRLQSLPYLTEFTCQGQHIDRPSRPRLPGRLRSTHDHLGPREPSVLELIHTRWHVPMDEPRAH